MKTRFPLLAAIPVLFLAVPALCGNKAASPGHQVPARYNLLVNLVKKRLESRGEEPDVRIYAEKAVISRKKAGKTLKPVIIHFDSNNGLSLEIKGLDYLVEHWRQVRFEQSMNVVRIFDSRDERIVYGFGNCPWRMDDSERRRCKAERKKELAESLKQVLREIRKLGGVEELGNLPGRMKGDAATIARQISKWCWRRQGQGCSKADVLSYFGRAGSRMTVIQGAKERTLDGFLWARPFLKTMKHILRSHGVPEDFAYLASAEAHFRPFLRSHSGAVGPWQFLSSSARERGLAVRIDLDERRDMLAATEAAARYLREQYLRLGDWALAAISYNQGPSGTLEAVIQGGTNRPDELIAAARKAGGRLGRMRFRVGAHYWPIMVAELVGMKKLEARAEKENGPGGYVELVHLPVLADDSLAHLADMAEMAPSKLYSYNLALGPMEDLRHHVFRELYRGRRLKDILATLPANKVEVPKGYYLHLPAEHLEQYLEKYRKYYCESLGNYKKRACSSSNWIALFDLAHRSKVAELEGRWDDAIELLGNLVTRDYMSELAAIFRTKLQRMALRLSKARRFGLDGNERRPLSAASCLAKLLDWARDPTKNRLLDPGGKVRLEWARALKDAGDPWRARRVLLDLKANGIQRWAARALLKSMEPGVLPMRTRALVEVKDATYTEVETILNPDPGLLVVDPYSIADMRVCLGPGDRIALKDGPKSIATWTAEPWCGKLKELEKRLKEAVGQEIGRVDLQAASDMTFNVPLGAVADLGYVEGPEG